MLRNANPAYLAPLFKETQGLLMLFIIFRQRAASIRGIVCVYVFTCVCVCVRDQQIF